MELARTKHVPSKNYQDLLAWQLAMELAELVYKVSAVLPVEERYGLVSQMRRAAISIPANIAEGQGRRTCGEFLNHLSMAHGSVRELGTHVIIARRLGLLPPVATEAVLTGASIVGRLVTGLANSLKS
ncbi:MAG: four helix bundle protein [Vicinamibacterales bacterium]